MVKHYGNIVYLEEVSHLPLCIKEDTPPSPSGDDALKDLEAITEAYRNQIRLG